jgi:ubiquitin-like modifier-activating enzyme ATG7
LLTNLNNFQQKRLEPQIFFAIDYEKSNVISLKEAISLYNSEPNKRIIFAFYDPNTSSNFPGWPLRNYLALLSLKW